MERGKAGDADTTKLRLLSAARDLYVEEGFAKLSLREVARRVGVTAPAVYRHFDNKEALLREVCATGFHIFGTYLLRALDARSPRERMSRSAQLYLQFALENPRDYRVIFMGGAEDFAVVRTAKNAPENASTFQFLVDRVRECMDAKVIAKGDAEQTATMIWAHVHGLVSLRISGHLARVGSDEKFARFYQQAAELFLDGLAP